MHETANDFLKFRDVENKKMEFHNYIKVTDVKDVNIEKQSYLMHMSLTKARKNMQNTK